MPPYANLSWHVPYTGVLVSGLSDLLTDHEDDALLCPATLFNPPADLAFAKSLKSNSEAMLSFKSTRHVDT